MLPSHDTSDSDRSRVARLRRQAAREDLRLEKSRARTWEDPSYGKFRLVNDRNIVVLGSYHCAFDATLDDVERFLKDEKRPRWRRVRGRGWCWHVPEVAGA